MSLLVDKYRPSSLDKLTYHIDQASRLKKLLKNGDFPHLLVFGPSGSGKKTRVLAILKEIYGPSVEKRRIEHKSFEAPSGKKLEISTIASNFHIELSPCDVGIYDRVVVMEVIKTIAQTQQLDAQTQREFKVVVLSQVDSLTRDAQHALRRTMEKYSSTCRLILCCNSTSKLIPALRSRCLPVRVKAPSQAEIVGVLDGVARKEHFDLPAKLAERIANESNGNLRRALLSLELCRVQCGMAGSLTDDQKVEKAEWEIYLRETASQIIQEQSPQKLLAIRDRIYTLLYHCIPPDVIFERLVRELVSNCGSSIQAEVIAAAAENEHRMQQGSKPIFHIEAFIARFMTLQKAFIENLTAFL